MAVIPPKPELGKGATERPWKVCGDGKCSCLTIGSKDHPIADVTHGDWGDSYASVRLVKVDGFHAPMAEGFTEMLAYGNVPLEEAQANAAVIVEAVNGFDALLKERDELRSRILRAEELVTRFAVRLDTAINHYEERDLATGIRTHLEEFEKEWEALKEAPR